MRIGWWAARVPASGRRRAVERVPEVGLASRLTRWGASLRGTLHAGCGALARLSGGLLGLGFRAMRGVPHGDVGDDTLRAVPVLRDHVVGKPYARLLLDRVHGNGKWGGARIQIGPVQWRSARKLLLPPLHMCGALAGCRKPLDKSVSLRT